MSSICRSVLGSSVFFCSNKKCLGLAQRMKVDVAAADFHIHLSRSGLDVYTVSYPRGQVLSKCFSFLNNVVVARDS